MLSIYAAPEDAAKVYEVIHAEEARILVEEAQEFVDTGKDPQ